MKYVTESVEKIEQQFDLQDIYKHIETAARICYLSKSTKLSSEEFVHSLIKKEHLSPLSHGTVYLTVPFDRIAGFIIQVRNDDIWSKINVIKDDCYITTNFRRLYEKDALDWLNYLTKPTEYHALRSTYKVVTSIGISRELNRHATALSICESSTRYCNYSKNKFGNEITFIKPYWYDEASEVEKLSFDSCLKTAEKTYLSLIEEGKQAQEARSVLPLQTTTTVIYTGFDDDWKRICDIRGAVNAHPECQKIIKLIQNC